MCRNVQPAVGGRGRRSEGHAVAAGVAGVTVGVPDRRLGERYDGDLRLHKAFIGQRSTARMGFRRRELLALSATAAGGVLAGCSAPAALATVTPSSSSAPEPSDLERFPDAMATPSGPSERLALGNAAFGLDLLRRFAATGSDANRLFSPFSIAVALAMTYAGARGETRTEMREALRYDLPDPELHAAFATVQDRLAERREVVGGFDPETPTEGQETFDPFELLAANAVWAQSGFPWRDAYLDLLRRQHDATLRTADFRSDPRIARQHINDWAGEHTEGLIPRLLPEGSITTRTRMVLANALYFRSRWAETFPAERTTAEPFDAIDGGSTEVPMMTQEGRFPYAEFGGHQAVELPYVAEGFGMVVLLPAEGTFERVERSLTAARLQGVFDALSRRSGTVSLPRFTFRSDLQLSEALSALGMPTAFDERAADFSGMTRTDIGKSLFIDEAYHQGFIGVDERGTEAAAVTGVVVNLVSATPTPTAPFELVVDRPFLFFIRDARSGAVVFVGRVVDAGAAQSG